MKKHVIYGNIKPNTNAKMWFRQKIFTKELEFRPNLVKSTL